MRCNVFELSGYNNTHTINTASVAVVDSVNSGAVTISQGGATGGNYRCETIKAIIKPNMTENFNFSWPYDMAVTSFHFVTNSQHIGDSFTTAIAPNTIIGYITKNVDIGDTVISVNQTVLQNAKIGYIITLMDDANVCQVGFVTGQDQVNGTITLASPCTIAFSATTPTYVAFTIENMYQFQIGEPNKYDIGSSIIEGGLIPANTQIQLRYTNRSLTDVKTFIWYFEYFY